MSFNVGKNKPLILRLTLTEPDDSKFIRAYVRRPDGVELLGSPFTLQSLGEGRYLYQDANLKFPTDVLEVSATYQVFDDEDFLIPTVDYTFQVEDVFRLNETEESNILTELTDLNTTVKKVLTLVPGLEADVSDEDAPVVAEIQDDSESIEAEVEEN